MTVTSLPPVRAFCRFKGERIGIFGRALEALGPARTRALAAHFTQSPAQPGAAKD